MNSPKPSQLDPKLQQALRQNCTPVPLPPKDISTLVNEEIALILGSLRSYNSSDPTMITDVNRLMKLYDRVCEIVRLLASLDPKSSKSGKEAGRLALRKLIESSIENVKSINSIQFKRLRDHARMCPEFPILVTGHPSWEKKAKLLIKDLDLGGSIDGGNPVSRTKRDIFARTALEVLEQSNIDFGYKNKNTNVVFDDDYFEQCVNWYKDWDTLKSCATTSLNKLLNERPQLLNKLKKEIHGKKDAGNEGRLKYRVKERILERLKSQIGANKFKKSKKTTNT